MSANQNTLYPALQELKSAALANYQPAPCEVCHVQPTRPYVIAFAKETGSSSSTSGNTTTTVKTYSNLAARAVSLCPACLEAHRQVMLRRALTGLIIGIAIALIGVGLVIVGEESAQVIGAGVGTVAAIIALIFFAQWKVTRTNDERVGKDKALRLHRDALKAQGYDSFWTDELG
jgi:hypothetical protein